MTVKFKMHSSLRPYHVIVITKAAHEGTMWKNNCHLLLTIFMGFPILKVNTDSWIYADGRGQAQVHCVEQ